MHCAAPFRSRWLAILAASSVLALATGCSGQNGGDDSSSTGASVEELSEDGFVDEDADGADLDGLGPDQDTMMSDLEAQAEEDLADPIAQTNAEREWDELNMLDGDDLTAGVGSEPAGASGTSGTAQTAPATTPTKSTPKAPAVKCKKRIHVTFAVYTYLETKGLTTNGCWVPEATVQDPDWRGCHIGGPDHHVKGPFFFYDDTNPNNPIGDERHGVRACAHGEKRGYEYMAFRDNAWRIVRAKHVAAYYGELYLDDQHVDNLWYQSGIYRKNPELRGHKRVAPMLNIAPYPSSTTQREIGTEVLKVCKSIRNHGFIGLYGPAHHEIKGARLRTLVRALNKCTRR